MKQNKYYSYNHRSLSKGCQLCVKGRKTVIYVTGICSCDCYYCPLSDQKKNKDVQFANERKVSDVKEMIEEIKACSSKGAGLTGGDPLLKLDRTIKIIKELKKEFGKDFHIHLYTTPNHITKSNLKKLYDAGLDEIRVHPSLEIKDAWKNIALISEFDWKKGIEIPAIPSHEKMIQEMIEYARPHIDFLNLNEFEYSDRNEEALHQRNYYCRSKETYAIEGSKEMALKLMAYFSKTYSSLPVHFCTAKLKDATQIAQRLKLRAKNVAQNFDIIDDEGMLIRGSITPGSLKLVKELMVRYDIPEELIQYDALRKQVLIAPWILEEISDELQEYSCQLVTEYPTYDRMIVEVDPL